MTAKRSLASVWQEQADQWLAEALYCEEHFPAPVGKALASKALLEAAICETQARIQRILEEPERLKAN